MWGPLDATRWAVLSRRGLVTPSEQDDLTGVRKAGAAVCAMCHGIIERWRTTGHLSEWQAKQLNEHIGGARGLAAKQIAFELTDVPFPFFHLLTTSILMLMFILQWNSALRVVSLHLVTNPNCKPPCRQPDNKSYPVGVAIEALGGVLFTICFKSIWHTAIELTKPYGDDECDYDIDLDLQQLWVESLELLSRMPGPRTAAICRFTDCVIDADADAGPEANKARSLSTNREVEPGRVTIQLSEPAQNGLSHSTELSNDGAAPMTTKSSCRGRRRANRLPRWSYLAAAKPENPRSSKPGKPRQSCIF